jgi:nitroreductase
VKTAYECWEIKPISNFSALNVTEKIHHLLNWGILAANAHNAQPWKIVIEKDSSKIAILLSIADLLTQTDKENRQAITSLGCFVENIILASKCYEVKTQLNNNFDSGCKNIYQNRIEIQFDFANNNTKLSEHNLDTLNSIKNRRSNRLKFDSKTIPNDLLEAINERAQQLGLKLFVVTDTATRLALSELQYMADRTVVALPGFREELLSHLIENNDLVTDKGMPGFTFGLSQESTQQLKMDLSKSGILNPDWAVGFASAARDGIRSAPVLIIACGDDNPKNWIKAGQFFQSSAVEAQKTGVASAYNAAMVESVALNSLLKLRLGTLLKPLSIFRLGFPLHEVQHSPRRNLNNIIELLND